MTSIQSTIDNLENSLKPATEKEIAFEYMKLLVCCSSSKMDDSTAQLKMECFVEDMSDLPIWAIALAARKWRRGEGTGNHAFVPNAAQLRALCADKMRETRVLILRLNKLLKAELVPQKNDPALKEKRQEMVQRFKSLISSLGEEPEKPTG